MASGIDFKARGRAARVNDFSEILLYLLVIELC